MGEYSQILNGMLGSVVRTILNKIGSDLQLSYRRVSSVAEIPNEINYWTTGTIVYSELESNYYRFDGSNWVSVYLKPQVESVKFKIDALPPAHQEGVIYWDEVDHTLSIYGQTSNTSMQVGQEFWARVVNKTGSTLWDGQVVFISGAQGNRPTAQLAIATSSNADRVIGIVTADILKDAEGNVTTLGVVRGYNTSSFNAGDILYLSETILGGLQNTPPQAPKHAVKVAIALNSTQNGSIYVFVNSGTDLDTVHDVLISSPLCGDVLTYTALDGVWKNRQSSPINSKVSDYTATRLDDSGGTILVTCSTQNITINLPALSDSKTIGMTLTVKKIDSTAFKVIVNANGSDLIDGNAVKELLSQYEIVRIHANSSGWWII